MESYLYIGGAQNGKYLPSPDVLEAISGVFDEGIYIRDTLTIGDASITIYRQESLTSEQVLDRFVDSYHELITLHALMLKRNPAPDVELGEEIDSDLGEEIDAEEDLSYGRRLWNLETYKDPDGNRRVRRYVRFVNKELQRRSRVELGVITPELYKQLGKRRGSGRHKLSREDADALRRFAESVAESVWRDKRRKQRGRKGKDLSKR